MVGAELLPVVPLLRGFEVREMFLIACRIGDLCCDFRVQEEHVHDAMSFRASLEMRGAGRDIIH